MFDTIQAIVMAASVTNVRCVARALRRYEVRPMSLSHCPDASDGSGGMDIVESDGHVRRTWRLYLIQVGARAGARAASSAIGVVPQQHK